MITIFYSWQSDLNYKFNRSLIETCIKKAIKKLKKSNSIKIDIRLDSDTKGKSGTPSVSEAIFDKILDSNIFIGDVSLINSHIENERLTPNPNVLTELGYAAGILNWNRVLIIYNKAFGKIEDLPFDLKGRRPITYNADQNSDLKTVRQKLINIIALRIEEILQVIDLSKNNQIGQYFTFFNNLIFKIMAELQSIIFLVNDQMGIPNEFNEGMNLTPIEMTDILSKVNAQKSFTYEPDRPEKFDNFYEYLGFKEKKVRLLLNDLFHFHNLLEQSLVGKLTRISAVLSSSLDFSYRTPKNKYLDVWINDIIEIIILSKESFRDIRKFYKPEEEIHSKNWMQYSFNRHIEVNERIKEIQEERKAAHNKRSYVKAPSRQSKDNMNN